MATNMRTPMTNTVKLLSSERIIAMALQRKRVKTAQVAYDRAVDAEENADTVEDAWRLAEVAERCLADLRAAIAGAPAPSKVVASTLSERARKAWATRRAVAAMVAV